MKSLSAVCSALLLAAPSFAEDTRPNIVIMMVDDLGFSEIKSISFSNKQPIKAENKMGNILQEALANNKKDKREIE